MKKHTFGRDNVRDGDGRMRGATLHTNPTFITPQSVLQYTRAALFSPNHWLMHVVELFYSELSSLVLERNQPRSLALTSERRDEFGRMGKRKPRKDVG